MFKNMKLQIRLTLVVVIVVIIASISGILSLFLIRDMQGNYYSALQEYGFAQGDIGNLGRHFQRQRSTALYTILSTDAQTKEKYKQQLATEDAAIDADLAIVKKVVDQATYDQLSSAFTEYRKQRDEALASSGTVSGQALLDLVSEKCSASSQQIASTIDQILSGKTTDGTSEQNYLMRRSNVFMIIIIFAILFAVVIAMLLATAIARGIVRPLKKIETAAVEMSKGNLRVEIDHESTDEIGVLAASIRSSTKTITGYIEDIDRAMGLMASGNFNVQPSQPFIGDFKNIENSITKFIMEMCGVLVEIRNSSEQVSAGADQVSDGAQALSQGATQQASAIEELSASISEISNQVKQNAENAGSAREKADLAGAAVMDSNSQMKNMLSAMSEINTKSVEISKIVKTIEDIAFQTNILALNAAVEAARAGSAGKGFAVVADEVRNLAGKSAEAAKSTTTLIEETVEAVGKGTRIADGTAAAMDSVITYATETTELIVKIADATKEQASAIGQITIGIDQISGVVQTNSATAEESAAASEELSGQASILKSLVEGFELLEGISGSTRAIPASHGSSHHAHSYGTKSFGTDKY